MKSSIKNIILPLTLAAVISSCQQMNLFDDYGEEVIEDHSGAFDVTLNVGTNTVDTMEFVSSRTADAGTLYAVYLFSSDSACVKGHEEYISDDMSCSFSALLSSGEYVATSLVGYSKGETTPSSGLKLSSAVSFPKTLHNLYLGQTALTVAEDSTSYSIQVSARRLMATLSIQVSNVPADVKAVSVLLPNQASQFTMKGEVIGTDKAQTISLAKGSLDSSGLYTWSVTDQIIYPSADGCKEMPIKITATYNNNSDRTLLATYKQTEEGKTCCTRGTKTYLTSKMSAVLSSAVSLDEKYVSEDSGTF